MALSNRPSFNWQIEHLDPTDLKLPDNHVRRHGRSKIERVKAGIDELGFYVPILIDEHGEVVVGVARVMAARELELPTIPVLRQAALSPAVIKAIRIADNKMQEGSTWNPDQLAADIQFLIGQGFDGLKLGFATSELDQLLDGLKPASGDIDAAPPAAATAVTRLGDLWRIGGHAIVCGDARDPDVLGRLMGQETASAIITDSPFNVKIDGHVSGKGRTKHDEFAMGSGEMSSDAFKGFNRAYLMSGASHLAPGGCIYAFMDWRSFYLLVEAGLELGLAFVATCIWVKTNAGMGSFYRSQHEMVAVFRKPGGKPINNVQLGRFGRNRTNVWTYAGANAFGVSRNVDLADHPTVKPVVMIADAIKDCTRRSDIVLDLFGGSGTTMLAAEQTDRRARLCEIEPKYVDVTLRRMKEAFDLDAIHVETGKSFENIARERLRAGSKLAVTEPSEASSPALVARPQRRRARA